MYFQLEFEHTLIGFTVKAPPTILMLKYDRTRRAVSESELLMGRSMGRHGPKVFRKLL